MGQKENIKTEELEPSIFIILEEAANKIWDNYGIRTDSVDFDWLDIEQIGGRFMRLKSTNARLTKYPNKNK